MKGHIENPARAVSTTCHVLWAHQFHHNLLLCHGSHVPQAGQHKPYWTVCLHGWYTHCHQKQPQLPLADCGWCLRTAHQRVLLPAPFKCVFEQTHIEYLGLMVNENKLSIDPTKADSLRDWFRTLTRVKEVQSILGVMISPSVCLT